MERRIRALGINVEEEGKIENEEIMRALDRSETRVMILGQKDDKLFLEEVKKMRRSRKEWKVKGIQGIDEIPARNPTKFSIYAILDLGGNRLTEKFVEEKKGSKGRNEQEIPSGIPYKTEGKEGEADKEEDEADQPLGMSERKEFVLDLEEGDLNQDLRKQHFQWVQGVPPTLPTANAGEWIKQVRQAHRKEESQLSPSVARGLAVSTRNCHRRCIRWLETAPDPEKEEEVSGWLIRLVEEENRKKGWKGTTLATKWATLQGCLVNLPLYRQGVPPVLLRNSPEWGMGLKGAGNAGKASVPSQPMPLTLQLLKEAIALEPMKAVRVALELAWISAARGGDILKLRTRDVEETGEGTRIKFVIGKTATSQPYTVATTVLSEEAKEYLKEPRETEWLFPGLSGEAIKRAVRRAHPRLEQRSVRRGAIQTLAATGMEDAEILHYSQHRSLDTLRRYLDFGWLSGEAGVRGARAGVLGLRGKTLD